MTARELIKLLLDYPLDRELYVGKGMGLLADVEIGERWAILVPARPEEAARDGIR